MILLPLYIFLSRLCGGQQRRADGRERHHFLSRLCGGQLSDFTGINDAKFLSRLCGGQHRL